MSDAIDLLLNTSLWAAVLRIATPLIFGVLGALLCERSGVLNLGIEGIMTMGAMTGWLTVYMGAPLLVGLLESYSSFWASAFKEVIVFTLIIPVLLWRSLTTKHVEEEE